MKEYLLEQRHMAERSTFLQPFPCRRLSFQHRLLVPQRQYCRNLGTELQSTWIPLHSIYLAACVWKIVQPSINNKLTIVLLPSLVMLLGATNAYVLLPILQNVVSKSKPDASVNKNRTLLY